MITHNGAVEEKGIMKHLISPRASMVMFYDHPDVSPFATGRPFGVHQNTDGSVSLEVITDEVEAGISVYLLPGDENKYDIDIIGPYETIEELITAFQR